MEFIGRLIRKLAINGVDFPPYLYSRMRCSSSYKNICLTIDDGPDPIYTIEVLEIFNKYSIKAGFFCIGMNIEENYKIAEQIYAEGHTIQNHSYSHRNLSCMSDKTVEIEIRKCRSIINGVTGEQKIRLFRPPHGLISLKNIWISHKCEENVVLWTDVIENQCLPRYTRENNFVLMTHDAMRSDVDNLKRYIPIMIDSGCRFIDLQTALNM